MATDFFLVAISSHLVLVQNYPVRITSDEDPKRIPWRKPERYEEAVKTERISSACFVCSTETNTGVRELPESKRPNGTNGRVPSQIIKGGYGRTTSEFAVELTRTTASDFSGDEGDFGDSWEQIVHPYQKYELFERTSVFVCFALRTQAKPDEAESISNSSPNENENTRTNAN